MYPQPLLVSKLVVKRLVLMVLQVCIVIVYQQTRLVLLVLQVCIVIVYQQTGGQAIGVIGLAGMYSYCLSAN